MGFHGGHDQSVTACVKATPRVELTARRTGRLDAVASRTPERDTVGVDVEISAEVRGDADEKELQSLLAWLQQERPRPGHLALTMPEPKPGTMGVFVETLQVALGAGGAGAVLAGSLSAWIQTRRQPVSLRLRRRDGEELSIDADVKNPEAIIEQFLAGTRGEQ